MLWTLGNVQLEFFYFQKAFDSIDHSILLDNLCMYGVRGTTLSWFSRYLSNIYEYVVYNDCESECQKIPMWSATRVSLGPTNIFDYHQ